MLRYVALGDSYAAGRPGDDHPPWPELVRRRLGWAGLEVELVNLGVFGAVAAAVLEDQVEAGIEARPDVLTLVCGANDVMLRLRPDVPAYEAALGGILARLTSGLPDTLIATATYADFSRHSHFRPRSRKRVEEGVGAINDAIRRLSAEHGCTCVDINAHPGSRGEEVISDDGIHASAIGHERTAHLVAETLWPRLMPDAPPFTVACSGGTLAAGRHA